MHRFNVFLTKFKATSQQYIQKHMKKKNRYSPHQLPLPSPKMRLPEVIYA
jgi:hypothetical protein